MRKTPKSIKAKFDEQNLGAARIISAGPVRYLGEMQEWAALVLKRLERHASRNNGNNDMQKEAAGSGRQFGGRAVQKHAENWTQVQPWQQLWHGTRPGQPQDPPICADGKLVSVLKSALG